jgi:hypothetical protein
VVLGLNLALGVANGLRYQSLQPPGPPVALRSAPSGDPFRAYAALAVAQLLPAPDVGAVGRRFIEQEENRAWGTP